MQYYVLKSVEVVSKMAWRNRTEYVLTTEQKAAFYTMERKAEIYARSFYRILAKSSVYKEDERLIPISFLPFDELKEEYKDIEGIKDSDIERGRYLETKAPVMRNIQIALPVRVKNTALSQSLKRVIRHELIHYFLAVHDYPHKDDSALFHAFCLIYNAESYMELKDEEKRKYNIFLDFLNDVLQEKGVCSHSLLALLAEAVIIGGNEEIYRYWLAKEGFQTEYELYQKEFIERLHSMTY